MNALQWFVAAMGCALLVLAAIVSFGEAGVLASMLCLAALYCACFVRWCRQIRALPVRRRRSLRSSRHG